MKRFIKIPITVLELDLTPLQLLVYAGIVSLKSKNNYTVATGNTIAKRCGISSNSVYTAVKELEAVGLISKTNNIKNGRNTANGYHISCIGGKFVKIDYSAFKYNLSPSQFAAYVIIKSKCNHANRAFPSLKQISKLAHICIDTVISAVRALADKGLLLFKHYLRRCGCYGHNNYIIIDNPQNEETEEAKIIKLTITEKATYKKAASFFLNKIRYSKFWATRLDLLNNAVRKRIYSLINTLHIHKLKV